MSILNNSLLLGADAAAGGYEISRSVRFNSSDSAYLSRTPASAGNRRTWTVSCWVKLTKFSGGDGYAYRPCLLSANNINIEFWPEAVIRISGESSFDFFNSFAVFRDPSAWYHIVIACDTTLATGDDRFKVYVNNVRQANNPAGSPFQAYSPIAQNNQTPINNTTAQYIGCYYNLSSLANLYLADFHLIDGQALTPSSFGEFDTNNVWQPIDYAGTFGTNGFHLPFSDNSTAAALGTDTSGNGNTWTVNNLSVTAGSGNDSLVDTPTSYGTDTGVGGEVRGNYCTWNPLAKGSNTTLSNGNLDMSSGATWQSVVATLGATSGKWYWEQTMTTNQYSYTGICNQKFLGNVNSNWPGQTTNSWSYLTSDGLAKNDQGGGAEVSVTLTTMASGGGTLGFALDLDNQKLWFSLNGVWMGSGSPNPATGTAAAFTNLVSGDTYFPCADVYSASAVFNFGQRAFAYTAPSGFKALCDTNLGAPVVAKPNTVMDVVLYTGTGAALTPTSSLGFNPDWIWIKSRSAATDHALYDVVRGAQARLESNTTDAEVTTDAGVTAFNSAGFTLGTLAQVNTSSATYAAWCWDAGTSTVTNTAGSITSSCRTNQSSGFSIVSYTGNGAAANIGHGLGVEPHLIIQKFRGSTSNWSVYTKATGAGGRLKLNTTDAFSSDGTFPTTPTSSLFYVNAGSNDNGVTMIAYCFAPVAGYSSFGSYTGNGSTDGPFVYTGFRPAFVLIKTSSTSGNNWYLYDYKREAEYNPTTKPLFPDGSFAEQGDSRPVDLLSNGFKIRYASFFNANGETMIYAAFAQNPFQYARAR